MSDATHNSDREAAEHGADLVGALQVARFRYGKGLLSMLLEIVRLRFGPGRLTPADYFKFRLFDDATFTFEDKKRFVSDELFREVARKTCHTHWIAATSDKLVSEALFRGWGLPVTESVAALLPGFRRCQVEALRNTEDVARFLRTTEHYPLFAKQLNAVQAWGARALLAYDSERDAVEVPGGAFVAVDELAADLTADVEVEYVFQRRLTSHPDVQALIGDRVGTVRTMVILGRDGPELLGAVWRIPMGSHPADSFWRKGNMLGQLDPETGDLIRVVRGAGISRDLVYQHPDTGASFEGYRIPHWGDVVDLSLRAASYYTDLGYQSFDIHVGPDGPLIVEHNVAGAFSLSQIASDQGFATDRWREFYEGWTLRVRNY